MYSSLLMRGSSFCAPVPRLRSPACLALFALLVPPVVAQSIKLNGPLPPGGDVLGFEINGAHALYTADQYTDEAHEMLSVLVRGGEAPVSLGSAEASSDPLSFSGAELAVSPDGLWLVQHEHQELRSYRTNGGQAPLVLTGPGQVP